MKLLGAILLMGGATALGLSATARLERRVETVRALLGALERMTRELSFRLTPIPEMLRELSQSVKGSAGAFFFRCYTGLDELGEESLCAIWEKAMEATPMDLRKEEEQVLRDVGQVLGRYDEDAQIQALALAGARMTEGLKRAEEERSRLGRVYTALGVTAGAFLTLLLL